MKTMEKKIGTVSNYFEHISVAAIKLDAPLKKGDSIRIIGGDTDFEQRVDSIQIHHQSVSSAKKGDEIGIKVAGRVRKGYKVLKA